MKPAHPPAWPPFTRSLSVRLIAAMLLVAALPLLLFIGLQGMLASGTARGDVQMVVERLMNNPALAAGATGVTPAQLAEVRSQLDTLALATAQVDAAVAEASRTRRQTAALIFLAPLLLAVGMAIPIGQRMTAFSRDLSEVAAQVAAGNLSARMTGPPPDNTESMKLYDSFNRMARTLEEVSGQARSMIGDIAHELRTPLTVLQGRIEAMQDGVVALDLSELEKLHRQTELLARLVTDLRTLSLADAGQLSLEEVPLDLARRARIVTEQFGEEARACDVRLSVVLEASGEAFMVSADPDRLSQVVGNLISNALHYVPRGGEVDVRVGRENAWVTLSVSDNGPGVPDAERAELFGRFYRTDSARTRSKGGSGLGLAIVQTLTEAQGGQVEARRGSKGGLEVLLRLPALKPEGAPA